MTRRAEDEEDEYDRPENVALLPDFTRRWGQRSIQTPNSSLFSPISGIIRKVRYVIGGLEWEIGSQRRKDRAQFDFIEAAVLNPQFLSLLC